MITVKNVSKSFKNQSNILEVLKHIDFSVSKGAWVSIVGPSGSGKSTLLNIVSGLLRPDSGEVCFNDTNIYELTEQQRSDLRRKHIGFVFQDFKLLPYYSVLDNVILPLYYDQHKNELYKRAKKLLHMVGIHESLFSRLPEGLSGGEKQRVAIARALIANPDVLICDEPTGNLDQGNRDNIIDLFCELKEQGKTIILVTHDMDVAVRGDDIYHLVNGTLTMTEVSV
jgi:putative ABC transport system ATP-binding protein